MLAATETSFWRIRGTRFEPGLCDGERSCVLPWVHHTSGTLDPNALWKLNCFLRDFGYDSELLGATKSMNVSS